VIRFEVTVERSQSRSINWLGGPRRLLRIGAPLAVLLEQTLFGQGTLLSELNLKVIVDLYFAEHALKNGRDLLDSEESLFEHVRMLPSSIKVLFAEFSVLSSSVSEMGLNDLGSGIISTVSGHEEFATGCTRSVDGLNSVVVD